MRNTQSGVSIMALIMILVLVLVVALFGMRVVPSFLEYRAAKNAIEAVARERPNGTPAELRRAFENRATIDDINSVKPADLEITKDASGIVVGFAYRKEVPLFKNVGLYIDYVARSGGQ
jgi:hypothetical protein